MSNVSKENKMNYEIVEFFEENLLIFNAYYTNTNNEENIIMTSKNDFLQILNGVWAPSKTNPIFYGRFSFIVNHVLS